MVSRIAQAPQAAGPQPCRRCAPLVHNAGMDIVLNGESRHFESAPLSIATLLDAEGLGQLRVAVEVNGEIVPRGRHAGHLLQPGDRVEIVHALGGG